MGDKRPRTLSLSEIILKTGAVVGSAAVGLGGAAGCTCRPLPPPPSDSFIADPPPPPSDSTVDPDSGNGTDSGSMGADSGTAGTDSGISVTDSGVPGTDSGFIADPPPPPIDSGASLTPNLLDVPDREDILPLDPSFRLEIRVDGLHDDGALILQACARNASSDTRYEWHATGGEVVVTGDNHVARWIAPEEPGQYLVQVIALRKDHAAAVAAFGLEV